MAFTEVVVHSLSCVRFFVIPWSVAHQASLSVTNSRSLLKLMSIVSVMPSNYQTSVCSLVLVSSQQRFGVTDIKALGASQLSGLGQTML